MKDITLEQIGLALAFIAALIASIGAIGKVVSKAIKKGFATEMKPINDKLDSFESKITEVDINTCKNFLVARLTEIEAGQKLGDIGEERFWEEYQHYQKIGGNSYIKKKVEQLEREGKL